MGSREGPRFTRVRSKTLYYKSTEDWVQVPVDFVDNHAISGRHLEERVGNSVEQGPLMYPLRINEYLRSIIPPYLEAYFFMEPRVQFPPPPLVAL